MVLDVETLYQKNRDIVISSKTLQYHFKVATDNFNIFDASLDLSLFCCLHRPVDILFLRWTVDFFVKVQRM